MGTETSCLYQMIETQVWATLGPLLGCHTIPLTLQRLLESFSWKLENSGNHLNPSLVGIKLGAVWGGGHKVVTTSTTCNFA